MSRPGNHDVSADGKSNNNKHSESDWDAMKKCNFRLWTERKQYRDKADVIHNNFCQFINDTKEITDRRFSQLISEISDLGESSAQTKYICNLVIDLVREKAGGLKCEVSSRADEFTCWDADERTKTGWQDMNGENRKQSEPDQDRELADSEVESHKHDHGDELETTEGHEASDQYEASDEHETSEHRNPGDENDNYEHEHGALGHQCDPAYPFLLGCRKVYINAASGKQVQRRSTDVVLSECDDTSIKLLFLVEQILRGRNATEFSPELQRARKRLRQTGDHPQVVKRLFKGRQSD